MKGATTRRGFWPVDATALAELLGAELVGDESAVADRVTTDSRAGIRKGDLFVGLVGPNFDGGDYARAALAEGATIVLTASRDDIPATLEGAAWLIVADTLEALQTMAAAARQTFDGRVVGITGSNGKTTVKEMLAAALGQELDVATSPLSYNSQVGVALSLLDASPTADVCLVECGISQPGEMERLERMVRPDLGLFVNVGDAHLEGLGSRETIAREKARLFHRLPEGGVVICPAADRELNAALDELDIAREHVVRDGEEGAHRLSVDGQTARVRLRDGWASLPVSPPFATDDAALAAVTASRLGASADAITTGLSTWAPAPGRFELSTTSRGVVLLNDAYSADPTSVEAALRALCVESGPHRTIAVLGGMAQLGRASRAAHRRVGRRVNALGIDVLVGVGAGGREIVRAAVDDGFSPDAAREAADVDEAATMLDALARAGDRVLVKGSRPERLERLVARFFDSFAPTRLYVDLDQIVENLHQARRAVGDAVAVMAVVKSFGYGADSVRLAHALERAPADYYGVAYCDEAIRLRERGVDRPILVANVLPNEADKVVRFGLTATITTREQLPAIVAEVRRQARLARVHLKVDTGMGRAGFLPDEAPEIARSIDAIDELVLEGVMTHFASSEDAESDDFTRTQIGRFDRVVRVLREDGIEPRYVHACNSAAIARFPEAHYTMVRLGLGMFGYTRVGGAAVLGQRPALRLVSRVVSVKALPAGHSIGYGRSFTVADEPMRVAVVALGYNDGYPFALSNRGTVTVRGRPCPVVGRVCMDVTMVDVSAVPDVEVGDDVVIFGTDDDEPSLHDLAHQAGTIEYELLTRIAPRVRRIFLSTI